MPKNKLHYKINYSEPCIPAIAYTWNLICDFLNIEPISNHEAAFTLGSGQEAEVFISARFAKLLESPTTFRTSNLVIAENGRKDYITTIFYLVNCIQEYHVDAEKDKLGRYDATKSIQYTNYVLEENLVVKMIMEMVRDSEILNDLANPKLSKSKIQISHDIDFVKNAFLKDAFYAVRKLDARLLLNVIIHEYFIKPELTFIPKILDLHDEYDIRATFFWMVEKGYLQINDQICHNADYKFENEKLKNLRNQIKSRGHAIGLHKSLNNEISFDDELKKLQEQTKLNRNHFLHFNLPDHFNSIEQAGFHHDCSLGYSSHMGFRNSYGMPFQPFHLVAQRVYTFHEWPIHIMDTTFQYYQGHQMEVVKKKILDFLNRNKSHAVISLLWHNNSFQYFRTTSWLELYKEILDFVIDDFDFQEGYNLP